jgi:NADH:ubiquinone oxidoreductase subunit 3 (subunit A)
MSMGTPRVSCTNTGSLFSLLHLFVVLLLLFFEIALPVLFLWRHGYRERKMFPVLDLS